MMSQMRRIALGTSIQETNTDTTQTFIQLQRALCTQLTSETLGAIKSQGTQRHVNDVRQKTCQNKSTYQVLTANQQVLLFLDQ